MQFGRGESFWSLMVSIIAISVASKISQMVQVGYLPINPPQLNLGSALKDPTIGTIAPSLFDKQRFPLMVALHTECQSCTANPSPVTFERLADSEILNVVSGAEMREFDAIAKKAGSPRILIDDGIVSETLNAYFTGRVYIFDKSRRLCYMQPKQSIDSQEIKAIWNAVKKH